MTSRRAFLHRLGVGLVGALALAHVPASVVKTIGLAAPATDFGITYLARLFNEHTRGRAANMPTAIYAGRELFEAVEDELAARNGGWVFVSAQDPGALMFKGTALYCEGRGWTARIV